MADSVDHEVHDFKRKGDETIKAADQLKNPDANPKDEKKNEANKKEEDIGNGDESSEDEEHLGLLDKPVVVEGKRERKSTEFLYTQTPVVKKETKPIVFEGKGQSLGSIERVNFEIGRTSYLELKPLHRLLYGREGKQNEVKKNIRNFNGFSFDKDSKQFESKQQGVERFTMDSLKRLCEIFDIEKKGKRDDLTEKVMNFLMSPKSSGRPLPSSKQKKTNKRKKKKSTDKKAEVSKRKRTLAKSKKEVKGDDDDDDDDDEDEEEEKTEEEEGEESEEETEKPPKKKRKTEKAEKPKETLNAAKEKQKGRKDTSKGKTKENKISDKKKSPKKKEPVAVKIATPLKKGSPKKKPAKEKPATVDDDSSSDEEPLAKKAKKQPPTDNELETSVKKILHGADLEQVTMKSVCKQIFEMFPDFDLTSRKDFIKETVKKVIS